jgi:hypothetical protein
LSTGLKENYTLKRQVTNHIFKKEIILLEKYEDDVKNEDMTK